MPRDVRLAVLGLDGRPHGSTDPLRVESQWWPDVEPVVEVFAGTGLDVLVLRVLSAASRPDDGQDCVGGRVSYLAQLRTASAPPLGPMSAVLDDDELAAALADHPLRAPWARPGGPTSILAWADDLLAVAGTPRTGRAEQVKTWNLSSILRLPTANGPVWCKSAPPFFQHEGAIIAKVAQRHPRLVPQLLGTDPATGTVLMADVPGEDQWNAPAQRLADMIAAVVDLQDEWVGHADDLLALGLPDWRGKALADSLAAMLARADVRADLEPAELAGVDALAARLPARVGELDGCGLGDTVVHGDLHPGNWRYGPRGLLLLDWGDSGVGNPLLDLPAFLERVPAEHLDEVRRGWVRQWRARRPEADVERAIALVPPLAALRQALIYRTFLDRIEPDEHVYHRGDPAVWVRRAVQLSRDEPRAR
ncbi:phosphotransferase family protein [Angustibacter sp. McL0619]|uniref:phosphotransferase family protein n=1 Tax=Angustibacter sp. McL0619 TaxID=3415676 RepID=UPI003CEE45CF